MTAEKNSQYQVNKDYQKFLDRNDVEKTFYNWKEENNIMWKTQYSHVDMMNFAQHFASQVKGSVEQTGISVELLREGGAI